MVCTRCGATSDEGQRFCYNCGAKLDEQGATTVPQGIYQQPPVAVAPPKQSEGTAQPYGTAIQPGYQTGPTTYLPQAVPNSTTAIISLVAGILSWVLIPVVAGIVAVVTGHMARREIRASGGRVTGDGLALIGLILGYANLVLIGLGLCLALFFIVIAAAA